MELQLNMTTVYTELGKGVNDCFTLKNLSFAEVKFNIHSTERASITLLEPRQYTLVMKGV